MKLMDINCGIGAPLKSHRYQTAEGLLRWMDDYRIDSALAYHSEALREPEMGNALMQRAAAASGGRLRLCFAVNPSLDSLGIPGTGSVLERLRAARPSALRVFPKEQDYPFNSFYADSILAPAQALRLPVVLDMDYTEPFLNALPQLCADYPDVPFIFLRYGFKHSRTIFPMLRKLRNVYLDTSIMVDVGQIEELVERFGSERLLFGSGLPTYVPDGALGLLLYAGLGADDFENITHRNFERLEGAIRYDD